MLPLSASGRLALSLSMPFILVGMLATLFALHQLLTLAALLSRFGYLRRFVQPPKAEQYIRTAISLCTVQYFQVRA